MADTVRVSKVLARWLVVYAIGAHRPAKVQMVQMTRIINGAASRRMNVRYFLDCKLASALLRPQTVFLPLCLSPGPDTWTCMHLAVENKSVR